MLPTFNKALSMGFLSSYKKTGWLWLSLLVVEQYCRDCPVATGSFDDETHILELYPFNPGAPFTMETGWVPIWSLFGNGSVLHIPELLPIASKNRYFGQYIPKYDNSRHTILIDLKERVKKYVK